MYRIEFRRCYQNFIIVFGQLMVYFCQGPTVLMMIIHLFIILYVYSSRTLAIFRALDSMLPIVSYAYEQSSSYWRGKMYSEEIQIRKIVPFVRCSRGPTMTDSKIRTLREIGVASFKDSEEISRLGNARARLKETCKILHIWGVSNHVNRWWSMRLPEKGAIVGRESS